MPGTNPSSPQQEPSDGQGDDARVIQAPGDEQREIVLVKAGQRYVFRYVAGEESKMLSGLAEMARDPKSELDWFDAAVLSHQLGQTIGHQLQRLRKSS